MPTREKLEPHANNFGARLRVLIAERGMSLLEFSRAYGISEAQVHNWLKRADAPLAKHWPKLARFFGVSEAYIGIGAEEKLEPTLAEEPTPYHAQAPDRLTGAIRDHVDHLLAAAGEDPARLGWIREEMIRRLTVPEHWRAADPPTPPSLSPTARNRARAATVEAEEERHIEQLLDRVQREKEAAARGSKSSAKVKAGAKDGG